MAKFTDEELRAAYEAHKDDSKDDLKKYLKSLPLAQQMQYNGYAEERRRENLSPEERKKEDRNVKIGCAIFLLIIIFCIATCGRSDEKPSKENKPAQTIEQQVEKVEKPETDKKPAENQKTNTAPTFTKEIISANVKSVYPDAKNLTVMIYDTNIFDVNFDLERAGVNETQARSIAVKAIKDVIAANNGCQFNVVGVIVTSKKAPVCVVTFADNHYVSIINGKREEFTP